MQIRFYVVGSSAPKFHDVGGTRRTLSLSLFIFTISFINDQCSTSRLVLISYSCEGDSLASSFFNLFNRDNGPPLQTNRQLTECINININTFFNFSAY